MQPSIVISEAGPSLISTAAKLLAASSRYPVSIVLIDSEERFGAIKRMSLK